MAPPDTPSVETLVHIYAPSGARDDANYRAHADACLDFQPVTRLRLSEQDVGMSEGNVEPDGRDELLQRKQIVGGGITLRDQFDDSVFDDDTQKTRSLDSRASSGASQRPPCFEFPLSSAPKSSARVEISLLSSAENSQSQDSPSAPPVPALPDFTSLEDSIPFGTPPNTVPDSQPVLTPAWDVERNNSPGNGRIRLLQVQGSQLSSQELQSPAKRPRLSVDFPPSSGVASAAATLRTSSVSLAAQGGDLTVLDYPDSAAPPSISTLLSRLPMEVHPARPQPSTTAEFTTHITPTLHMLAEKMKLGRLFKPVHQARPLRTLERGYWYLRLPITANAAQGSLNAKGKSRPHEPHPWPIALFDRFWKYLSTLIGKEGRAGWGIWCICEADPGLTPNLNDASCPNSADICLTVRIYTWGETAAHIYLLLYLASERKIKRLPGMEWRDGKEEPVIRMS